MTDPVPYAAWLTFTAHLIDRLGHLADGETLELRAHESFARPTVVKKSRTGLGRGKVADRPPWLIFTRSEDHLRAELIGSVTSGGPFPWGPDEREAFAGAGWHPQHPSEGGHYVRWWPDDVPEGPYLDRRLLVAAASAGQHLFAEVLEIEDPDEVTWESPETP